MLKMTINPIPKVGTNTAGALNRASEQPLFLTRVHPETKLGRNCGPPSKAYPPDDISGKPG